MKLIKEVLGRIFALWAAVIFIASLLVVFIPIWLTKVWPEPKRTIQVFRIFHVWMKFFFVFSGVKRIFKGRENFRKGENYVIVCNHNSYMDIPLSSPGIPGPNKTIAKTEMAKIPLFGMIYKRGSVLVDRKSEESRRNSFSKMKEVLDLGLHMCIYPEGTRNKSSQPLKSFHSGAFRLSAETGKEIIPAMIFNTRKVLPADKTFYALPHKLEIHFLPAVKLNTDEKPEAFKDRIHKLMSEYYIANK